MRIILSKVAYKQRVDISGTERVDGLAIMAIWTVDGHILKVGLLLILLFSC